MNTTTLDLGKPGLLAARNAFDWVFAALLLLGAGYAWQRYGAAMDIYERAILVGSVPALVAIGWFWRPLRALSLGVGAVTLLAINLYLRHTDGFGADLAAADQVFWLKYLLSSQSAILWMSTLFFMATL